MVVVRNTSWRHRTVASEESRWNATRKLANEEVKAMKCFSPIFIADKIALNYCNCGNWFTILRRNRACDSKTSERAREKERKRQEGRQSASLIKCASCFDGTFTFMAESGVSSWDLWFSAVNSCARCTSDVDTCYGERCDGKYCFGRGVRVGFHGIPHDRSDGAKCKLDKSAN